jgi:hypothetical protein
MHSQARVPDLTKLNEKTKEDEEEIGVALTSLAGGLVPTPKLMSDLYYYFYPQREKLCEQTEERVVVATHELWIQRELNVTERVARWDHAREKGAILDFFKKASSEKAPKTLAHVVRTQKKATNSGGVARTTASPAAGVPVAPRATVTSSANAQFASPAPRKTSAIMDTSLLSSSQSSM